jgi:hypothetical protein
VVLVLCYAAATFGLTRVEDRSTEPPLIYQIGSRLLYCIGRPISNQHDSYTIGLPTLSNTSSTPVTILSARGVLSKNMRLAQMYIVPWPKRSTHPIENVGSGFGLPSQSNDTAVGASAATRRFGHGASASRAQ